MLSTGMSTAVCRQLRLVVIVAALLVLAACRPGPFASSTDPAAKERPPNVIFILVDDLGWSDLGVQGSDFYETQNIDALAAGGVRFTDAYAAAPVCSPTRASLLTGRHPARLQITNWIPGDDPQDMPLIGPANRMQLPLQEKTIAEALREEGYATFFAGKWHLGGKGFFPQDQGFDVNVGGVALGRPPGGYYSPYSNPALTDGPDGEFLTDRLTDEAITFIEQHKEREFFVYLSYYTVHTPLQGADRFIERYRQKLAALPPPDGPGQVAEHDGLSKQFQDNVEYASMIHSLDENVGRILRVLEQHELASNTYVIFTSDNGGRSTLYEPGDATSNLPLRAGKGWLYEGGLRVPLIVRGPGLAGPGTVSDALVSSVDFYPTILELLGFDRSRSTIWTAKVLSVRFKARCRRRASR